MTSQGDTRAHADRGYVDWMFTTPLMLIELGILAGAQPTQTITLIAAGRNMLKLTTIRRKFRSQTSDIFRLMDRCSNSGESSQRRERVRREEAGQETDRREEVREEKESEEGRPKCAKR